MNLFFKGIFIKAIGRDSKEMVLENVYFMMDHYMRDFGKMIWLMV
jgi:hypothetical protein